MEAISLNQFTDPQIQGLDLSFSSTSRSELIEHLKKYFEEMLQHFGLDLNHFSFAGEEFASQLALQVEGVKQAIVQRISEQANFWKPNSFPLGHNLEEFTRFIVDEAFERALLDKES